MKSLRFQISVAILLFATSFQLHCQSWEYGASVQYLSIGGTYVGEKYSAEDVKGSLGVFCFNGGLSLPIYSPINEFTIGIQAAVYAGGILGASGDGAIPQPPGLFLGAPGYLTVRYGAGSNRNSSLPLGVGLGYGVKFSSYVVDQIYNEDPEVDNSLLYFTQPNLLVELVLDHKRGRSFFDNLKLRIELPLKKYEQDNYYEEYDLRHGYTLYQTTISFVKFLDYR